MKAAVAVLVAAIASVIAFLLISQDPAAPTDDGATRSASGASREERSPAVDPLASVDDAADPSSARSEGTVEEIGAPGRATSLAAAEDDGSEAPAFVVGRITDAAGAPIAGADALAQADAWGWFDADDAPEPVAAGPDGRFRIEVEPGRVSLVAGADGYAPLDRALEVEAGETVDAGELRLAPGVLLSGRVVDEVGKPVEGAELRRPLTMGGGFVATGGAANIAATTDGDGRFTVRRQAPGAFDMTVTHRAYPTGRLRGRTERAGDRIDDLEVVLEVGAMVSGRITGLDDLGEAERGRLRVLANVAVDASGVATDGPGYGYRRRATPEPDGTFTIRGLDAGAVYELRVQDHESFWGPRGRRSETVSATGGDRGVLIPYDDGPSVRFRLVGRDGAPIEDAEVRIRYDWDERVDAAIDDDAGAYAVHNLWARRDGERPSMSVAARGFITHEIDELPIRGTADVDLGTIVMEERPQLIVTVRDRSTGVPIEGARVEVSEASNGSRTVTAGYSISYSDVTLDGPSMTAGSMETDEEGRVSLDVTPGKRVVVDVRHPEFAEVRLGPIELAPGGAPYEEEARLEVGATVVVTLVDSEGRPVPDRSVDRRRMEDGPSPEAARADEEGVATFRGLAAGTHGFSVARRQQTGGILIAMDGVGGGGSPAPSRDWTEVEVGAGETVELQLVAPTPSAITGVLTERGEPLAGARVEYVADEGDGPGGPGLRVLGGGGNSATTDARGEFRIEGLDPGDGELTISHATRAMPCTREFTVEPGENEAAIDLDVTTVTGVVTGPDGNPLAGARVSAERKQRSRRDPYVSFVVQGSDGIMSYSSGGAGAEPAVTDTEGRYELRGVAPDVELETVARHDDLDAARSESFEVPPGGRRTGVDLAFIVPGSLEITFPGNEGQAIAVVTKTGEAPRTETFEGETVRLDGLAPGTYTVNVTPLSGGSVTIDGSEEPARVEVKAGETTRYTVE